MPRNELDQLLQALKERNIPLNHDDVAWAFAAEHTKAPVQDWAREYLSSQNLLTNEELTFHQSNVRPKGKELPQGPQAIEDSEYEDALSSIEASTVAIDRQCRLLEQQKQALSTWQSNNVTKSSSGSQTNRQSVLRREKAQLDFEIRQLSDSLTLRLGQSVKVADATTAKLSTGVGKLLEKDDRLLEGLQRLGSKLPPAGKQKAGAEVEEVEELCVRLTLLTAEESKAKVDQAYLSCPIEGNTDAQVDGDGNLERLATLRAELDDLSNEIDGLVSIVVDQQYRRPIMNAIDDSNTASRDEQRLWESYVSESLRHISSKAEATDSHAQQLQAYTNSLRQISSTLKEIVAQPQPQQNAIDAKAPSPEKPQKGLKPLRLLQRTASSPSHDPVTKLLQHLSLPSIPQNATSDTTALHEYLKTVAETTPISPHTAEVMNRALAQHLSQTTTDQAALLEAVYSHTRFGEVRLADEGLVKAVEGLEAQTKGLGDEMRRFDFEGKLGEIRDLARRLVVERGY
ncbi:hypothetical protein MBLNU230_g5604t1 [Neophaeotheca triangularis]